MITYSTFVCIDDKHRVKIGEPDAPVAFAERGRQVIVHSRTRLEAADHDFMKFSIIPSVVLVCDMSEEVSGSWYTGEVYVMLKEGAFELSSPLRHSTELSNVLGDRVQHKPILFVHSDGGPDHRVTYISVKLALIVLFRKWMLTTSVRYELLCITHTEILLKGSCPSLILVSKLLPLLERSCQWRWKQKPLSAIP